MRSILITSLLLTHLHATPLEIRFNSPPQSRTDKTGFPASNWESQAQPVGNGRIGAMIFGNPLKEHIQFNDISLWTGGDNPSGDYKVEKFGSYQNFGNLYLEMKPDGKTTGFSRSLDLATGIHTTTWKQDCTTFTREVFASKLDEAIVIRIQADQPGKVSGVLQLAGAHQETTTAADGQLAFSGTLANGLRKAAKLKLVCEKVETTGDKLTFQGDSATLILTVATDYALDPAKNFRSGVDPVQTVSKQTAAASAKTYNELRKAHLADFQKLMGRVDLDIGQPPADPSIGKRLKAYKNGTEDPHLEGLMFQYGRYLLISDLTKRPR